MAFKFNSKEKFSQSADRAAHMQAKTASQRLKDATSLGSLQSGTGKSSNNQAFPAWLKDGSTLKQLPAIYLGVLGQVQLQSGLMPPSGKAINKLANGNYMDRFIDTERVHQLLSASRLSNEVLATIWAHVNKTFPGRLTNREVCLALALVATFQELNLSSETDAKHSRDPFTLVRLAKKPPIPKLYPNDSSASVTPPPTGRNSSLSFNQQDNLLVDLGDVCDRLDPPVEHKGNAKIHSEAPLLASFNLIDADYCNFSLDLAAREEVWIKFLSAIRVIYKRSYDILNVEHSRTSALEALKSQQGRDFSMHLCLTYPLAHNIKIKIDELDSIELGSPSIRGASGKLFSKGYASRINDLMNSVNEYWAVLINLFHESGQTRFIESIMDGLKMPEFTSAPCAVVSSGLATSLSSTKSFNMDQIVSMLSGYDKPDVCSICYSKFYLPNLDQPSNTLDNCSTDLMRYQNPISSDNHYYYHPKCANFWLNQICSTSLPFVDEHRDETILIPATKRLDLCDSLI